jgi:hypothetical protein
MLLMALPVLWTPAKMMLLRWLKLLLMMLLFPMALLAAKGMAVLGGIPQAAVLAMDQLVVKATAADRGAMVLLVIAEAVMVAVVETAAAAVKSAAASSACTIASCIALTAES